jgi:hypothetical protein
MCSIDLEPCDLWRETPRIARKPHHCSACGAAINPGDAYLDHFSLFEGETSSEAACYACWLAREEFADAHGQKFTPSALEGMLSECYSDLPKDRAFAQERRYAVRWAKSLRALKTRSRRALAAREGWEC